MPDEEAHVVPWSVGKPGHYEILNETIAKFEFLQHGWNPYIH